MTSKVYRVFKDDEVIALFNKKKYANDFVDYQATISNDKLKIESVDLSTWLLQPSDF